MKSAEDAIILSKIATLKLFPYLVHVLMSMMVSVLYFLHRSFGGVSVTQEALRSSALCRSLSAQPPR